MLAYLQRPSRNMVDIDGNHSLANLLAKQWRSKGAKGNCWSGFGGRHAGIEAVTRDPAEALPN